MVDPNEVDYEPGVALREEVYIFFFVVVVLFFFNF